MGSSQSRPGMTLPDPKVIASLPEGLLKTIPGGTPPPGVQALRSNPPTLRPQTIATGSVFLAIAAILFAIRVYVKARIVKKLTIDDYVCTAGFLLSLVQFSGIMLAMTSGAGGIHMWDTNAYDLLARPNTVANWITTVFVTPALGLVKLTFLIQYYQLFWPLRWVRLSCWIGGGISMLFYLAISITMFALCSPRPGESFMESLLSKHFINAAPLSIPTGAIGAAVDIFLLVLPVRAVMTLHLPRSKKLGLIVVFMTGALASVASLVGLAYRIDNQNNISDAEWIVSNVWIWMMVELFSGIACSCMPSVSKLLSTYPSVRATLTPRNILSRLRSTDHRRLPDIGHVPRDSSTGSESAGSESAKSGAQSRHKEKVDTTFALREVQPSQRSPTGVRSPTGERGRYEHEIHLVQEVSVYHERVERTPQELEEMRQRAQSPPPPAQW